MTKLMTLTLILVAMLALTVMGCQNENQTRMDHEQPRIYATPESQGDAPETGTDDGWGDLYYDIR
jgi:uncharacterized lipoprotein NlpE involved in copper resistance